MTQPEIDALLFAHHGNARAVAFLHLLRESELDEPAHAFLEANASALTAADLLRWRARTPSAKRAPILVALAELAKNDPKTFEHEVLNAPSLSLEDREWETLVDIVQDKVPAPLFSRIAKRELGPPKPAPNVLGPQKEESLDLASIFDAEDQPKSGGYAENLFGEGSLSDALGLDDFGGEALADPFAGLTLEDALAKVLTSQNGDERAMLLEWVEANGLEKNELMSAALLALKRGPLASSLCGFFAQRLASKEAWTTYGRAFVSAMIERRAFPELQELLAQGTGFAPQLLDCATEVFAQALIDEARARLPAEKEPDKAAYGLLAALSCLEPTKETKKRFGPLKQAAKRSKNAPLLIPLIDRLVRLSHAKAPRSAPLEALVAAVHALSDSLEKA